MQGSTYRDHRRDPWRCVRWPLVQSAFSLYKLRTVFALLLLLGSLLLCAFVALYGEHNGARFYMVSSWGKETSFKWMVSSKQNYTEEDTWRVFEPPPWRAEFMGRANLHVFEEWCGSSIDSLRKNVHFPLHPHTRTTVTALAVAPQQINYGLRIFGYLHPPADGEYQFALSSDDNSELWLSSEQSPLHLRLRAWVGKTGVEWSAPGEFDKFLHQTSMPIRLSAQTRYFFEVLLKQNNKGTDHVVVAWRRLDQEQDFVAIQSEHISLYVDESSPMIGDIEHIPQTVASHEQSHTPKPNSVPDMQREDPRDIFYQVPLINRTLLSGLLPDCVYKPSYTIKGVRLSRYQGLHHVHLSYIYPNDHTRLTHQDTETTCFYPMKPHLFNNYIIKGNDNPSGQKDPAEKKEKDPINKIPEGEGVIIRARRTLSVDNKNWSDDEASPHPVTETSPKTEGKENIQLRPTVKLKGKKTVIDQLQLGVKKSPLQRIYSKRQREQKLPKVEPKLEPKVEPKLEPRLQPELESKPEAKPELKLEPELEPKLEPKLESKLEPNLEPKLQLKLEPELKPELEYKLNEVDLLNYEDLWGEEPDFQSMPIQGNSFENRNWAQTFKIKKLGYQGQKSHALNMDCRLTGNIQIRDSEVKIIVEAFMDKFNQKHKGWSVERVVNVVMNADVRNGKRYLLELELKDETGALRRLSHYIYALLSSVPEKQPKLCNPVGFRWTPEATVHFVIPVKNQAKWVHLLIKDVEKLVKETGDLNFNLILTDFSSTDMNIEEALTKSKISRYKYKKLEGNFERSRGLQEGVNLIDDPHSIVFLFDLHIRFPSSILDLTRKHCVEGFQAFAPIVLRLDCGASPMDARGWWEVQGFGLLGIYKSDLDRVGGMNTRDFKYNWGGEDWELLDRILVGGLEVERFYMRNFYHHFHTKRGMWTSDTH